MCVLGGDMHGYRCVCGGGVILLRLSRRQIANKTVISRRDRPNIQV